MSLVLAVVPDLFFAAKLAGTARATGAELAFIAAADVPERCAADPGARLILDLHSEGALELVRALKADPRTAGTSVVGFYSHVDNELRVAALAAGVDEVLPRSAFVARLPALLAADGRSAAVPARIMESEEDLAAIVRAMRTVAVVGIKGDDRAYEPAHSIPAMLAASGREVIGINPTIPFALGRATLPGVESLEVAVDVLDVFRRIEVIPELAAQLIALPPERRPRTVWLQSGIRHDEAAARLVAAGMNVVQDACLGVYAERYD